MTEDKMIGWHHQLNGHDFEKAPGDGEGQGRLKKCFFSSKDGQELLSASSQGGLKCL